MRVTLVSWAALVALLFVIPAWGQQPAAPAADQAMAAAGLPITWMEGHVTYFDPDRGRLLISTSDQPLVVPLHATVMAENRPVSRNDIQVGDTVRVAVRPAEGMLIASRVDLLQPTTPGAVTAPAPSEPQAQMPAPAPEEQVAGVRQAEEAPPPACPPVRPGEQPGMPQGRAEQFERLQEWF